MTKVFNILLLLGLIATSWIIWSRFLHERVKLLARNIRKFPEKWNPRKFNIKHKNK